MVWPIMIKSPIYQKRRNILASYFLAINVQMCCKTGKRRWCREEVLSYSGASRRSHGPSCWYVAYGTSGYNALTVYLNARELKAWRGMIDKILSSMAIGKQTAQSTQWICGQEPRCVLVNC